MTDWWITIPYVLIFQKIFFISLIGTREYFTCTTAAGNMVGGNWADSRLLPDLPRYLEIRLQKSGCNLITFTYTFFIRASLKRTKNLKSSHQHHGQLTQCKKVFMVQERSYVLPQKNTKIDNSRWKKPNPWHLFMKSN